MACWSQLVSDGHLSFWYAEANGNNDCTLGEAKRIANANGLYLNNFVIDQGRNLRRTDLIDGRVAILRAGKDKHLVLALR